MVTERTLDDPTKFGATSPKFSTPQNLWCQFTWMIEIRMTMNSGFLHPFLYVVVCAIIFTFIE